MKKTLSVLLLISVYLSSFGQADQNRFQKTPLTGSTQNRVSVRDANLTAVYSFRVPVFNDWSLRNAKDSAGYVMFNSTLGQFGGYNGTTWIPFGGGSYTLPIATASVLGGIKVGSGLSINSTTGVLSATGVGGVSSVFGRTGDVTAQTGDYSAFYPSLSGSYANPSWITSLAYSKITGVPAFITTETDPTVPTYSKSLTAFSVIKSGTDALYYPIGNPNGYISSYTETDPLFNTKFSAKTTTDLAEGSNLYFTQSRVSTNTDVAANTAARHNAVTLGTSNGLSLLGQQLSLGLASSGVTGALSGSDWNTFNSKQNQLILTTSGTSGTASLIGNTLNIPAYATSGGGGSAALRVPITLASNGTLIQITWSTYSAAFGATPTDLSLIEQSSTGDRQIFTNWYSDDNGVTYKFDVAPETGSRNFVVVISGGSTVTSGNVTSVTSANGDISVTNSTTTPVLTLNSGSGANQIVKRNSSGVIFDLSSGQTIAANTSGNAATSSNATQWGGQIFSNTGSYNGNLMGSYGGGVWYTVSPSQVTSMLGLGTNAFQSKTNLSQYVNDLGNYGGFAIDADVVHKAGTETITGGKTFSSQVVSSFSNNSFLATNGTVGTYMGFNSTGLFGFVGTSTNHPFGVYVNNSEQLRILQNGNFGLGTPNPLVRLDVRGVSLFANADYVDGVSGSGLIINRTATTGNATSTINAYMTGSSSSAPLALQNMGGSVLVGTTTDNGAKLQVNGKATVSTAPTNPTDVVRLQDLSSYSLDANVVHKTGTETIAGNKTFTGTTITDAIFATNVNTSNGSSVYTQMLTNQFQYNNGGGNVLALSVPTLTGIKSQSYQDKNGTIALLSDIPAAYTLPTASSTVLGGVKVGSGLAIDGSGVLSATTSSSTPLFDYYTDVANSGASETDIYTGTVAASKLSSNGDKIVSMYSGVFGTDNTVNKKITIKIGGVEVFSTGLFNTIGNGFWRIDATTIRTSSTTARTTALFNATTSAGITNYTTTLDASGINFSTPLIYKLTAIAGSTGQLTGKTGTVEYKVAAP